MTGWVKKEILSESNTKSQKRKLRQFIDLGEMLLECNNLNGVMEIVAGLNSAELLREDALWKSIGAKHRSKFSNLEGIVHSRWNYSALRRFVATPRGKGPVVPYLGLLLHDLTVLGENHKSFLKDEMVNFEKLKDLGALMIQVVKLQETGQAYEFTDHPEAAYFFDNLE